MIDSVESFRKKYENSLCILKESDCDLQALRLDVAWNVRL